MGCRKLSYYQKEALDKNVFLLWDIETKWDIALKKCSSTDTFAFNGMERDDEIRGTGNHYDFGARIYDPRLGRWLGMDALRSLYPAITPYAFAGDCPIFAKDPDGNIIEDGRGNILYTLTGDVTYDVSPDGSTREVTEFVYIYADDGTPVKAEIRRTEETYQYPEWQKDDDGNDVKVMVTSWRTTADSKEQSYDCHGLTFVKGQFWVQDPQAEEILEHDGYFEDGNKVNEEDAVPGDKILYKRPVKDEVKGTYNHSGTLVKEGLVDSKWGGFPRQTTTKEKVEGNYSTDTEYYKPNENRVISEKNLKPSKSKGKKREVSEKKMQKILKKEGISKDAG